MLRLLTQCLLLAVLLGSPTLMYAQVTEPEYVDQYNALQEGRLVPLERATGVSQGSTRNWIVTVRTKSVFSFAGESSPVRVGPRTHFVVRLPTVDRDPTTIIKLLKLEPAKKARTLSLATASANMIPFSGHKSDTARNDGLPIHVQRFGKDSFEIVPDQPLAPGEYGFSSGTTTSMQCFGVDGGLTSAGAVPATAKPTVLAPPTPPPPVRPQHPANTVVDLTPAFPGAPPLHASRPAMEGCWWEAFGSRGLGIEVPVQHCGASAGASQVEVIETPNGLGVRYDPASRVQEILRIHYKTATLTVPQAIKHDLFTTASERASCVVGNEGKEGPFDTYGVTPIHGRKTGCPFYESDSDATTATTFFYDPAQSDTSYLQYTGEGLQVEPFDLLGLRFVKVGQ
jgi:hypothetical protein